MSARKERIVQIFDITSGSAGTLQSLVNAAQPAVVDSANAVTFAEQDVVLGQVAPDDFEPLAQQPQTSALSDQFSPASVAFLTTVASSADTPSGTLAAVSALALQRDLIDLGAALEQIQSAFSGAVQTQVVAGASSATATHTIALI
jgi:hypothetical protein